MEMYNYDSVRRFWLISMVICTVNDVAIFFGGGGGGGAVTSNYKGRR